MHVQEVLKKTTEHFQKIGFSSPRLDAELLISSALHWKRIELYTKFEYPLSEEEIKSCRDFVMRRARGEPVAYILGSKGFYKSDFIVKPGVLIPRPETELMVEYVIAEMSRAGRTKDELMIADLGCGTGCIGLSCLVDLEHARLMAFDISETALSVTAENAERLELSDAVSVINQDVSKISDPKYFNSFDLVLANPPYIGTDEVIDPMVRNFEPHEALFAADGGFSAIESWAKVAVQFLKTNGLSVFEIGAGQGVRALEYFNSLNDVKDVKILKDYAGLDRFVTFMKKQV